MTMFALAEEEKKLLLEDARETIDARLDGRPPRYRAESTSGVLSLPCGAFVTLHTLKNERCLRGCIGRMTSEEALEKTVRLMALEAAFHDPRFSPLTKGEWPHCGIEISVLSPLEKCGDPRLVKVGVHGLYLRYQGRAGVLLPQVPLEQGWDVNEYLDYICIKAGAPPKSYKAEGAELLTFTAVVFEEER